MIRSRRLRLLPALLAVSLAALPATPAPAEGQWSKLTITDVDLSGVSFPTAERGWAVGAQGRILTTANGGASWSTQTSGTSAALSSVDFVDEQRGWAVGAGDTILRTTDGGQTWVASTSGHGLTLLDVDFVDATHGWAVGFTVSLVQIVLATTDGGQTWAQQLAPAGIGLLTISFADRRHGFTAGYLGAAYRTDDGGATWAPMATKVETFEGLTTDNYRGVVRTTPDDGLIAGFRGEILRTENGGLTWESQETLTEPVRGLAAVGDEAFAVGDRGLVAHSEDGGRTWVTGASGTSLNVQAITASAPGRAHAVGASGVALAYRAEGVAPEPLTFGLGAESCDGLQTDWSHQTSGFTFPALAADLTGDGDTEIVAGGLLGIRALRPFENTEDATVWYLPLQASVQRLAAAELDGEPGAEIVAGTTTLADPTRAGVLAVDGDGDVLWSRRLPDGARGLRTGDLDGDGVDDVIAFSQDRALYTLSGVDGSDLRPPRPMGERILDARLGDLTGDGRPDIVMTLADGRVVTLDGATGSTLWTEQIPDGELRAATLADLTGDTRLDVVVGGIGEGRSVTPGNGDSNTTIGGRRGGLVAVLDGRDGSRIWDYVHTGQLHFNALTTADLNGDGVPDVIGHAARLGNSHLLALDGRGRTAEGMPTGEPLVLWTYNTSRSGGTTGGIQQAYTPDTLAAGDGNGDGTPDAYVGLWSGGPFAVDGTPPPPELVDPALRAPRATGLWEIFGRGSARHVSLHDIGDRRLVLSTLQDGMVLLQDAADGEIVWAHDGGILPETAAGDVNGDGRSDLIVGTASGRIYALDGEGEVLTDGDVFLPHRVRTLAAVDADGDGVHEAVAGTSDGFVRSVDPVSGDIRWERDLGTVPRAIAAGGGMVVVGGEDGRARGIDPAGGEIRWETTHTGAVSAAAFGAGTSGGGVFAVGTSSGQLTFLTPQGDQLGAAETGTASLGGVYEIAPGDLGGGGGTQFAVGAGATFFAYEPSGVRRWEHAAGTFANRVATGDVTGNGADDVVAGGFSGYTRLIDGPTGNLRWQVQHGVPVGAVVADLTGDQKPEVAVATMNDGGPGRIRLLDADGAELGRCTVRLRPHHLIAGHLDGPGPPVLAVPMEDGAIYRIAP